MKISKRTNRICLALTGAALIAIFFYQVAYGANDKAFMAGYIVGKDQGNDDWGHVKLHPCPQGNESGYCPISYPPGHTAELYAGYKTGYNYIITFLASG
jgi:hypothetical protein